MTNDPYISLVVPLYNEETNALELYARLKAEVEKFKKPYEMIFIDDGSKDRTLEIMTDIANKDERVTVIQLARNYGQSSALSAGFDKATGDIIISMDGDLQHDPADLPLFMEQIEAGYDIVSGWRKVRVDNFLIRRLPSRIANRMLQKVSGVDIHDFGTTYKAYRKEFIKNIELFGDYHRYIPALANDMGASIIEIPIKNINRAKGKSNYGIKRFWPVLLDIIMLKFVISYMAKPLRMFGSVGLALFFSGFAISAWMLLLWCVRIINTIRDHSAMLLFSVFLMLVGLQFIVFGILAEINSKIYFKVSDRRVYRVKQVIKK
jgi:glycosyltransferase involved in cell wall biosynthesis